MTRVISILLLCALAVLAGGWFFRNETKITPSYFGNLGPGSGNVSVSFVPSSACDFAARLAHQYRSEGWQELPTSTRTFKLFSRKNAVAAFLAEDVPQGGTRVTEFRSNQEFN